MIVPVLIISSQNSCYSDKRAVFLSPCGHRMSSEWCLFLNMFEEIPQMCGFVLHCAQQVSAFEHTFTICANWF